MISNLTDLTAGQKIKVIQSFLDFDRDKVEEGTEWTFIKYSYFPYDGGYTFEFQEGGMRFAEIDPDSYRVMQSASSYFELM
jgi:hypothetical protein